MTKNRKVDCVLEIIKLKIDDLTPYEKNAKIHTKEQIEQIKSSIKQFGMNDPIGVWGDKNIIVEGHGRLMALKELGHTDVDCIRLDHLTDEERRAYTLAHNKLTLNTDFDFDLLQEELDALLDFDMTEFGFDEIEVEMLADEVVEDEVPEEVETRCKAGDIWQLGNHRLMCGDSTSIDDVERLMDGQKAQLLLTDPPYNVNYEGGTGLKIQNDNMEDAQFKQFLIDAFSAADTVMNPGAAFYIWHADSEGYNFRGACHSIGWQVRQCLIWNKNSLVLGRQDYQWKHEPCLYGWKDGASHLWVGDRKQTTVIDFDKPSRNAEHPTMKPVGLFDYQIKNNTHTNDIVLDLFGGSGTTLIACEQNGRVARIMELDEHYCDVIIQRWEEYTGKQAIKL